MQTLCVLVKPDTVIYQGGQRHNWKTKQKEWTLTVYFNLI